MWISNVVFVFRGVWFMNGLQESFEDSFIQFGFPGGGKKTYIHIYIYIYTLEVQDQTKNGL